MGDPAPLPLATPPGWHLELATRRYRWWDGIQWAFYAPDSEQALAPAAGAARPAPGTAYAATAYVGAARPARPRRPTNGMATASLALGLAGLVLCMVVVPAVLAVAFGILGLRDANRQGGVGRAQSIWGIVLGSFVLLVIGLGVGANLLG